MSVNTKRINGSSLIKITQTTPVQCYKAVCQLTEAPKGFSKGQQVEHIKFLWSNSTHREGRRTRSDWRNKQNKDTGSQAVGAVTSSSGNTPDSQSWNEGSERKFRMTGPELRLFYQQRSLRVARPFLVCRKHHASAEESSSEISPCYGRPLHLSTQ